ncbi:Uu.00g025890.m01.CDS01 [Anthostomella pinea]|uniref:Uu.00g025890.m01.CDS01 n=1 Tax=Anthostomella pinea TaxID=933095 RepID=A0AAI8V8F8_9PEZI|nr:Uu.00g025890.m01.CDS01 [Anthostomella pinea]
MTTTASEPRPTGRKAPMQVPSLGFSRMGTASMRTASMRAALEQLGYHTHHGFDPQDFPLTSIGWDRVADLKFYPQKSDRKLEKRDLDDLLGSYGAVTDMPCFAFWEELVEFYPEAKVVLVQCDYDSWHGSLVPLLDGLFGGKAVLGYKTIAQCQKTWLGYFHARNQAEILANSRQVYDEHYLSIGKAVPPARLLNFELAYGWEPLCKFLDKDIPDKPFPRINDTKALEEKMMKVTGTRIAAGFVDSP